MTQSDNDNSSATDVEKTSGKSKTEKIRALNDALRTGSGGDGMIVLTQGIQSQGEVFVSKVMSAVQQFDAFTPDNDPHGEHDFAAFDVEGERINFKIDYYDLTMTCHSENASDPAVTKRVLTIMLASEY